MLSAYSVHFDWFNASAIAFLRNIRKSSLMSPALLLSQSSEYSNLKYNLSRWQTQSSKCHLLIHAIPTDSTLLSMCFQGIFEYLELYLLLFWPFNQPGYIDVKYNLSRWQTQIKHMLSAYSSYFKWFNSYFICFPESIWISGVMPLLFCYINLFEYINLKYNLSPWQIILKFFTQRHTIHYGNINEQYIGNAKLINWKRQTVYLRLLFHLKTYRK